MADMITGAVLCLVAALAFFVSVRSFMEKGFLLNNAYLYASKTEREQMDKSPYYRQTGVVFVFIGLIFLLLGISILGNLRWMLYPEIGLVVLLPIYAVVSAVRIERNKK